MLADIFKNFKKMCLEIYALDPTCFVAAPSLEWQAFSNWNKVILDPLTDIDKLLMVEKCFDEEYVTLIINIQKLTTNT